MIKLLSPFVLCLTASSLVAQVPCFDPNLGTQLSLADDAFSAPLALGFTFHFGGVAYTDVQVCSNGYIVFGTGATGAADYSPTVGELTGNPEPRICPIWRDLNPSIAGSGSVWYNAVPAAGSTPAYFSVTYDGVYQYATTTPISAQVLFIDGDTIQIHHDANVQNGTNAWVLGASPGNGATANAVLFSGLPTPVISASDTLHEDGTTGFAIGESTMSWAPTAPGYVVTQAAGCAAKANYGQGCVAAFGSFYEDFATTPAMDLSNTSITGILAGSTYLITQGVATFVAPSPNAINLMLGDDATTVITPSMSFNYPGGSTPSFEVCSNGYVSTGPNGASYQPVPATMLGWAYPTWAVWHDFIPSNGPGGFGDVYWEEIGGIVYITYDGLASYVGTTAGVTPSTFQFQFDLNSGFFHIVFQSMDTVSLSGWLNGDGYVVGYSPGNGAGDPGSVDLTPIATGLTTLQTSGVDSFPLELAADAAPIVNTTINLVTSTIPTTASFGGLLFGITKYDPGISLTNFGMPDCFQYNDQLAVLLFFPATASSFSLPFNVPNAPGVILQVQAAVYDPVGMPTPLGGLSSGGLELTIGN